MSRPYAGPFDGGLPPELKSRTISLEVVSKIASEEYHDASEVDEAQEVV
jgi:hypothetical protein